MTDGYGPGGLERAIVLTFDNLGEASCARARDVESPHPAGRGPLGDDAPCRGCSTLSTDSGLTATFFVEAVNCELNPAGGSRRSRSADTSSARTAGSTSNGASSMAAEERDVLARTARAFAGGRHRRSGFRPPGGELTPRTPALLREHGLAWCSPAGDEPPVGARRSGLGAVCLGARRRLPPDAALRGPACTSGGAGPARCSAAATGARLAEALRDGAGVQTVVMHPFLMLDEAWWEQVQGLLALVSELPRSGEAWVVPGGASPRRWAGGVGCGP